MNVQILSFTSRFSLCRLISILNVNAKNNQKKKKCVIKNQWVNVYVRRQIVYTNNEF